RRRGDGRIMAGQENGAAGLRGRQLRGGQSVRQSARDGYLSSIPARNRPIAADVGPGTRFNLAKGYPMAISDLKDLYTHGLKDLHSACKQSLSVTRDMQEAASSSELKDALKAAVQGTEDGMKKIERLLSDHGESAG